VFKYHAFIYFLRPPPRYGTGGNSGNDLECASDAKKHDDKLDKHLHRPYTHACKQSYSLEQVMTPFAQLFFRGFGRMVGGRSF
jgi:hypothetical protein